QFLAQCPQGAEGVLDVLLIVSGAVPVGDAVADRVQVAGALQSPERACGRRLSAAGARRPMPAALLGTGKPGRVAYGSWFTPPDRRAPGGEAPT
ncbi:hypothetical protein, partial [Streptomyces sp. CNQ085]|uniref:hypothetical protein n=1 Tax=Streptomyces sp. CNQ085 TaxID=2886944 RepID=UPI001F50C446